MNSIVNVSFNISFVFKSSVDDLFDMIKEIYKSHNDDSLSRFEKYKDYVSEHIKRMESEAKSTGRVHPAPFTLVDIDSDESISLLHYGDYQNSNRFNELKFSKYQTDSLLEIVACLHPELTDEDLSELTIERVKELIKGNVILLTDNNLISEDKFNDLYDKCENHFNAFKQTVRME